MDHFNCSQLALVTSIHRHLTGVLQFSSQSWACRQRYEPLTSPSLGRYFVLFQAKPVIMHQIVGVVKTIFSFFERPLGASTSKTIPVSRSRPTNAHECQKQTFTRGGPHSPRRYQDRHPASRNLVLARSTAIKHLNQCAKGTMGVDRAHSAQHPLPEQPRLVRKLRYRNHLERLRIPPEAERPSCCNEMVLDKGD